MADQSKNPMEVSLRLSAEAMADLVRYKQLLTQNIETVNKLKQELKGVETVGKALTQRQIRSQGVGGYLAGLETQARQRVERVRFQGTDVGANVSDTRQLSQQVRNVLRYNEDIIKQQQAQNLNLKQQLSNVTKITDLNQLRALREQALLRQGLEQVQGSKYQEAAAKRLVTATDARIQKLEELAATEKKRAAEELADAKRIQSWRDQEARQRQQFETHLAATEKKRAAEKLAEERNIQSWRTQEQRQREMFEKHQRELEKKSAAERLAEERRIQSWRDQERKQSLAFERDRVAQDRRAAQAYRFENRHEIGRSEQKERLFGDGGAHLMGVQAGLMTNYAILGGVTAGVAATAQFMRDFDESLHNLQATVNVADSNMGRLRDRILEVGTNTRFMATELAEAAVNLGQAGLGAQEIDQALEGVALLASATGTDLSQSVDLATSVLGVFNKSASQMGEVANTITQSVNDSKLSVDKLTLGLQYAGNTAAQSGVSFEELTAAMGAMSNAGIRSGSTLGTGLRQIMISMQKPSKGFRETLNRLGLDMDAISLQTHGLAGVMQNLRDAGFTAQDAMKSFEVRAAAAYNALAPNLDTMDKMQRSFVNSTAAIRANEVQMSSFNNTGRQLLSTFQSVATDALTPTMEVLRLMMVNVTDLIKTFPQATGVVINLVTVLGTLMILAKIGALLKGVMLALGGVRAVAIPTSSALLGTSMALTTMGASAGRAAMMAGVLATSLRVLRTAIMTLGGPLGIAVAAGLLLFDAFSSGTDAVEEASTSLDVATGRFDNARAAMEKTGGEIAQVGERIAQLRQRAEHLKGARLDTEAALIAAEFRSLGYVIPESTGSVDDLIGALTRLQQKLGEDYILKIETAQAALDARIGAQQRLLGTQLADVHGVDFNKSRWLGWAGHDFSRDPRAETARSLDDRARQEFDPRNPDKVNQNTRNALVSDINAELNRLTELRYSDPQNADEYGALIGIVEDIQKRVSKVMESQDALEADRRERARLDTTRDVAQLQNTPENMDLRASITAATAQVGQPIQSTATDPTVRLKEIQEAQAAETALIDGLEARLKALSESGADGAKLAGDWGIDLQQARTASDQKFKGGLAELAEELEAMQDMTELEGDTALEALDLSIAKLDDGDFEKKIALLQERKQLMETNFNNRIAAIDNLLAATPEEDKEAIADLNAEKTKATTDFAQDMFRNDEELKKVREAQLQEFYDQAEAAYEAARLLIENAKTEQEANDGQTKAMNALGQMLATQEQINLVRPPLPSQKASQDNFFASETAETQEKTAARIKSINKPSGRGGGGSKGRNKKSETENWVEIQEARVKALDSMMERGLVTSGQAVSTIEGVISQAGEKLKGVEQQLMAMSDKIATGNLSSAEQEKVKTLLDEQAGLLELIKGNYSKIGAQLILNGQYQQGFGMIIQSWAADSLDLGKTLEDGVINVLNTGKSALTDFFGALTDGTKSGKDAVRDFATSMLKALHQMINQMMAVKLMQAAIGWLNPSGSWGLTVPGVSMALGGMVGERSPTMVSGHNRRMALGGSPNRDSTQILAQPGEFLLRKSAVDMIGVDNLKQMNALGNRVVAGSPLASTDSPLSAEKSGMPGQVNVYVVSPDQKPAMSPSDVLVVIGDDIARGGSIKRLIKSVQMGHV